MIKVSVIIPVYNGENTIKKCIDSVLKQTLSDIEIIVVNDGSIDKTLDVLAEFGNKIKLLTIDNSGQGLARNKGIELAIGEYVAFLDADDTIEPDMYEIMYNRAKSFSSDIVQCAIKDITNGVEEVRSGIDEDVLIDNKDEYIKKYFYSLIHTNEVCNKLIKRVFIIENNLFFCDTKKIYSEDLSFNIDSLRFLKRISFVPLALYNYYIADTGHCKKNPTERLEKIWELYKNAIKRIDNKYSDNSIKSMAVLNTLIYSLSADDDKSVKNIITSHTFKKYCLASICYKKTMRHLVAMLLIIFSPYTLKKKIIKKLYTY